jgi:D-arabinose 1-dehydrogenase-like Zn-dependent alcohol dehydrogenase
MHHKAGSEHVQHVGIVGGGGLGHMGIKIAKALGCEVTAITTSPSKVEHLKSLGAKNVVVSTDEEAMKKASKVCNTFEEHEAVDLVRLVSSVAEIQLIALHAHNR